MTATATKSEVYFGGIPTRMDVEKIAKQWPNLKPGDRISYEAMSQAIGEPIRSNRFRTVTNAWRKSVEPNLFIAAEAGQFLVMTEPEKLTHAQRQMKSAGRRVRRSVIVCSAVDVSQLTDDEKKSHLHLQNRQASVRLALQQRNGGGESKPSLLE